MSLTDVIALLSIRPADLRGRALARITGIFLTFIYT